MFSFAFLRYFCCCGERSLESYVVTVLYSCIVSPVNVRLWCFGSVCVGLSLSSHLSTTLAIFIKFCEKVVRFGPPLWKAVHPVVRPGPPRGASYSLPLWIVLSCKAFIRRSRLKRRLERKGSRREEKSEWGRRDARKEAKKRSRWLLKRRQGREIIRRKVIKVKSESARDSKKKKQVENVED